MNAARPDGVDVDMNDPELGLVATKIQANFRGLKSRSREQLKKDEHGFLPDEREKRKVRATHFGVTAVEHSDNKRMSEKRSMRATLEQIYKLLSNDGGRLDAAKARWAALGLQQDIEGKGFENAVLAYLYGPKAAVRLFHLVRDSLASHADAPDSLSAAGQRLYFSRFAFVK